MKKYPIATGLVLIFLIGAFSILGVWLLTAQHMRLGSTLTGKGKIAVLEIEGVIMQSRSAIQKLKTYRDDASIKALIVRVDSPGGGVGPSQEIYAELAKLREKKLIIVSMGSVAASGGYYIACAGHRIFANPGTITGSIGVIIEFANVEELLGKIGLKSVVIKSGKYKDILSPTRELRRDEKELVQGVVDSIHGQFIDAVAKGRNMPRGKIAALADGRIFSGAQAKEIGLVDELGTLEDALAFAAEKTGLDPDSDVIYPEKKRPSIWEYVMDESILKITEALTRNHAQAQFMLQP